jgi:kojibiose phosphorylase
VEIGGAEKMELENNLRTETGWELITNKFDPEQTIITGSNFLVGNGYLGYRGTLAEWDKENYVGCIVTDTYDQADGKWRELCNPPNGLYTKLLVEGKELSAFEGEIVDHQRKLNFKNGVLSREFSWQAERGANVELTTERFASYDNLHLLTMDYSFVVDKETEVTLLTGIDGAVWDLNGEHFKEHHLLEEEGLIAVETITGEEEIKLDVVEGINIAGAQVQQEEIIKRDKKILRKLTFALEAGQEVNLEKYVAIYSSNDLSQPLISAISDVERAKQIGYDSLKENQTVEWDKIWNLSDIKIMGDLEAQAVLRFNLYHNTICTPAHTDKLPIGARGLSCQAYQGSAFWDQEIFNMPMFLYTRPEIAKNLLKYRYHTLDGARKKAQDLGYYGAYYAWISGKTGQELCPDYFFENVLTGRKIRNHFNDWQIHISPDIAYAMWQYYQVTGDWEFIVDYGAEVVFEVAQFLVAHAYFKKDKNRYEFIRLLGPDEYHENVDNNTFTNYQAQYALDKAVKIYNRLQEGNKTRLDELTTKLNLSLADLKNWEEMVELIYLPQPDEDSLLIEQFDGYFDLEDVSPQEVEDRLQDPHEYLGWPVGVATKTQVTKQADLLQLFSMQDRFSQAVMRANYDYYEPRCEHGSSLSPSAHAIIASKIGYQEEAYNYFMESCTVDLYNTNKAIHGGTFIGGVHTAACGAAWKMIVQGFAGLNSAGEELEFNPNLPVEWGKVEFNLQYQEKSLIIEIMENEFRIEVVATKGQPLTIKVNDTTKVVEGGQVAEFEIN